jgi:uncharacterized protein DUF2877
MHHAITVGTFVPRDFAGTVFSVHDHAINIKDDDNYRLISIVDRPADMGGLSLLVPRVPVTTEPGLRVASTASRIDFRNRTGSVALVEWGEKTPHFSGTLSEGFHGAKGSGFRELLGRIRELVRGLGARDGLCCLGTGSPADNVYARQALTVLDVANLRSSVQEVAASGERLAGLVGLGPGFTPSGDDFICGVLLAVEMRRLGYAHPDGEGEFETTVQPILDRMEKTTVAGATLLWLACRRSFPAYLVTFAQRVASLLRVAPAGTDAPARRLEEERAVADAISHGATSGTDALSGFLWMAGVPA